jgi:Site-specific recombinase XerD
MGKDLKGKQLGVGLYQRKDGRYEARAKINGIEISLYNFNLKQLKQDFEDAKEKAVNNINKKRQQITLKEWFEEWFTKYKVPSIKSTSVFPMKNRFYNSFGKEIGNMRVADITNIDVQDVINKMMQEGKASSSMRDALGRMRDCMEAAKNNQIISINPCFEINVPWENKQVMRRFLSREEQNKFLAEVEFNWYKEMFYIMFLTGMRIGEVGGLKWSDVDYENKCININRSLSCQYEYGNKVMLLTTPKTHNSYRKIPFFGEAEEMYKSQKIKQDKLKKELGGRFRSSGEFEDLVFTTSMGSPVLRYHAEKEINKIVDAINQREAFESVKDQRSPILFEDMYPHAIRHTFCSRCFEVGMQPKVVQAIMGHQHYSTTIDIYTHVADSKYEEEIDKFGNAVEVFNEGIKEAEQIMEKDEDIEEGFTQTFY